MPTKAETEKILKEFESNDECGFAGTEECDGCNTSCPNNQTNNHEQF